MQTLQSASVILLADITTPTAGPRRASRCERVFWCVSPTAERLALNSDVGSVIRSDCFRFGSHAYRSISWLHHPALISHCSVLKSSQEKSSFLRINMIVVSKKISSKCLRTFERKKKTTSGVAKGRRTRGNDQKQKTAVVQVIVSSGWLSKFEENLVMAFTLQSKYINICCLADCLLEKSAVSDLWGLWIAFGSLSTRAGKLHVPLFPLSPPHKSSWALSFSVSCLTPDGFHLMSF